MSKFVSPTQPRGYVNYEEMIKFLAKCIGEGGQTNRSNQSTSRKLEAPLKPVMQNKYSFFNSF